MKAYNQRYSELTSKTRFLKKKKEFIQKVTAITYIKTRKPPRILPKQRRHSRKEI